VRISGSEEKVEWTVEDDALRVRRPQHRVSEITLGFEISGAWGKAR
jgi:hypothetical protein